MKKYYLIMVYCFSYCTHFNIQGMERFSETIITFGGNSDYFGYGCALASFILFNNMDASMNDRSGGWSPSKQSFNKAVFIRSSFVFVIELTLFIAFEYWYYKNSPLKSVRSTCVRTLGDVIALYPLLFTGLLIKEYSQKPR